MTPQEFNQLFSDFIENANAEILIKAVKKNPKQLETPVECTCKRFFLYNKTVCCLYLYNEELFLYAGKTYKVTSVEHLLLIFETLNKEHPLVIILTGPDNIGKSTISTVLSEMFSCDTVHMNAIFGRSNEETLQNHKNLYYNLVKSGTPKTVVYDRFVEDEYVYGTRYRGGNPEEILEFIHDIETGMVQKYNVLFISLTSEPDFLLKNDDGKSLSHNKVENISYEIEAFKDIYYNSMFTNKKMIKVNDHDKFRPVQDIIKEIIS